MAGVIWWPALWASWAEAPGRPLASWARAGTVAVSVVLHVVPGQLHEGLLQRGLQQRQLVHGRLGVKGDVADGRGLEAGHHQGAVVGGLHRGAGGLEPGGDGFGHGRAQPDDAGRALDQSVNGRIGDEVALADRR